MKWRIFFTFGKSNWSQGPIVHKWIVERGMFLHVCDTFDDARQYVVEQIAEANSLQPKRWL